MSDIIAYDPKRFDEGYYQRGERGGFTEYEYDTSPQQRQLNIKWDVCQLVPHDTALFVGCARGFEIVNWTHRGKRADGVDVSEWAIANAHPEARDKIKVYDGVNLGVHESGYDLVAAFDVLTIPPQAMAEKLIAEMVRVARSGIVIRTIVTDWRNADAATHGTDGVTYTMKPWQWWDRQFTQSGKFKLKQAFTYFQYETTFWWEKA